MTPEVFFGLYSYLQDASNGLISPEDLQQRLRNHRDHFLRPFSPELLPNHAYRNDLSPQQLTHLFTERSHLFYSLQHILVASMDTSQPPDYLYVYRSFTNNLISNNLITSFCTHISTLLSSIRSSSSTMDQQEPYARECELVGETILLCCHLRMIPSPDIIELVKFSAEIKNDFNSVIMNSSVKKLLFSNQIQECLFNNSCFILFSIMNCLTPRLNLHDFSSPMEPREVINPFIDTETYSQDHESIKNLIGPNFSQSDPLLTLLGLIFTTFISLPGSYDVFDDIHPILALDPFSTLLKISKFSYLNLPSSYNPYSFSTPNQPQSIIYDDVRQSLITIFESFITSIGLAFPETLLEYKHDADDTNPFTHSQSILCNYFDLLGILYRQSPDAVHCLIEREFDCENIVALISTAGSEPSILLFCTILQLYENIACCVSKDVESGEEGYVGTDFVAIQLRKGSSNVISFNHFSNSLNIFRSELLSEESELSDLDLEPLTAILRLLSALFTHSKSELDSFIYEQSIIPILISLLKCNLPLEILGIVVNCFSGLVRHSPFIGQVVNQLSRDFEPFWQKKFSVELRFDNFSLSISIVNFLKVFGEFASKAYMVEMKFDQLINHTRDNLFPKIEGRSRDVPSQKWLLYSVCLELFVHITNVAIDELSTRVNEVKTNQSRHQTPTPTLSHSNQTLSLLLSDSLFFKSILICLNSCLAYLNLNPNDSDAICTCLLGLTLFGCGLSASNHLSTLEGIMTRDFVKISTLTISTERGKNFIKNLILSLGHYSVSSLSSLVLAGLALSIPQFKRFFNSLNQSEFPSIIQSIAINLVTDTSSHVTDDVTKLPSLPFHESLVELKGSDARYRTAYFIRKCLENSPHESGIFDLLQLNSERSELSFEQSPIMNSVIEVLETPSILSHAPFLCFELLSIVFLTCNIGNQSFSDMYPNHSGFIENFLSNSIDCHDTCLFGLSPLWQLISLDIQQMSFKLESNISSVTSRAQSQAQLLIQCLFENDLIFKWLESINSSTEMDHSMVNSCVSFWCQLADSLIVHKPIVLNPENPDPTVNHFDDVIKIVYGVVTSLDSHHARLDLANLLLSGMYTILNSNNYVSPSTVSNILIEIFRNLSSLDQIELKIVSQVALASVLGFTYLNNYPHNEEQEWSFISRTEGIIINILQDGQNLSKLISSLVGIFKTTFIAAQLQTLSFLSFILDSKSTLPKLSILIASELARGGKFSTIFGHSSQSFVPSLSFSKKSTAINQLSIYESKCQLLIALSRHADVSSVLIDLGILSSLINSVVRIYASHSVLSETQSQLIDESMSRREYIIRIFSWCFKSCFCFSKMHYSFNFDLASYFFDNVHSLPPTNSLLDTRHRMTSSDHQNLAELFPPDYCIAFVSDFYTFCNSIFNFSKQEDLALFPKIDALVHQLSLDLCEVTNSNTIDHNWNSVIRGVLSGNNVEDDIPFVLSLLASVESLRSLLSFVAKISNVSQLYSSNFENFATKLRAIFQPNFDSDSGMVSLFILIEKLIGFKQNLQGVLHSQTELLSYLTETFGINFRLYFTRIVNLISLCIEFSFFILHSHIFVYTNSPRLISSEKEVVLKFKHDTAGCLHKISNVAGFDAISSLSVKLFKSLQILTKG
ncbi:hypothetical protein P9112_009779 [Eukaryota sp. TZLM1-RC]